MMNVVVLHGTLSRKPEVKDLPSGDRLGSFEVTVRNATHPAESVPVVWFDVPARALRLDAGTEVLVLGRVRRRFFRSGTRTASRTEVLAEDLRPTVQHRQVEGLVDVAVSAMTDGLDAPLGGRARVVPRRGGSAKMGPDTGRNKMGNRRQ
jgi:single-strand DNA-binding protein